MPHSTIEREPKIHMWECELFGSRNQNGNGNFRCGQDRILKNETRTMLKKVGVLTGGITLALVVLWMIKRSTQVIARNIARITSSWIPQEQPNEMAEVETISKAEPKPLLVI